LGNVITGWSYKKGAQALAQRYGVNFDAALRYFSSKQSPFMEWERGVSTEQVRQELTQWLSKNSPRGEITLTDQEYREIMLSIFVGTFRGRCLW